jgi:hypothetical protein
MFDKKLCAHFGFVSSGKDVSLRVLTNPSLPEEIIVAA